MLGYCAISENPISTIPDVTVVSKLPPHLLLRDVYMATRGVSQVIEFTLWDTIANTGKTGDVGNLTLRWTKDGTTSAFTNAPSEIDATNKPGQYKITLTSSEADCLFGTLGGKSSTASVVVIALPIGFVDAATPAAMATTYALLQSTDSNVASIQARLPSDPADQSALELLIAGVKSDTNDIQTRLPAALEGGRIAAALDVAYDAAKTAATQASVDAVAAAVAAAILTMNVQVEAY